MNVTSSYNKVRELIAEYHRGRLQSTPFGKQCTDISAYFTLKNNFGNGFVEWPSELPLY